MKQKEYRIEDLTQGQKYHFRTAAGNLKGYSRFRNSTPSHVTPSSKYTYSINVIVSLLQYSYMYNDNYVR